jgi:DEAD/DEAH box helicase domain-containing protein
VVNTFYRFSYCDEPRLCPALYHIFIQRYAIADMADDLHDASSKNNEPVFSQEKEDAETRAARRELKQSSISDPPSTEPASSADDKVLRPDTPSDNVREDGEGDDDDLKEKVASPKKKRAHDQLDGDKEVEENDANSVASTDSSKDRTTRTEPEKKRHRDQEISEESSVRLA